ncbi:hypothetical protein EE612_053067 [Oryza sativa]|nr:hypothetical protein EE612_053067 [Oryza sativa]
MPTPVAAARQCLSPAAVPAPRRRRRLRSPPRPRPDYLPPPHLLPPSPRPHLPSSATPSPAPAAPPTHPASSSRPSTSASPSPSTGSLRLRILLLLWRRRRAPCLQLPHGRHQALPRPTSAATRTPSTSITRPPPPRLPPPSRSSSPTSSSPSSMTPVVSRVFAEAGFRSGGHQASPSSARLRPCRSSAASPRAPVRRLSSSAASPPRTTPTSLRRPGNLAGAGEENRRRIAEILSRGRNPMLVGVGAASAADDFCGRLPVSYHPCRPQHHRPLQTSAWRRQWPAPPPASIISIGDLKQLVPR